MDYEGVAGRGAFFDLYRGNERFKNRPTSARRIYLKHCEELKLGPLPILNRAKLKQSPTPEIVADTRSEEDPAEDGLHARDVEDANALVHRTSPITARKQTRSTKENAASAGGKKMVETRSETPPTAFQRAFPNTPIVAPSPPPTWGMHFNNYYLGDKRSEAFAEALNVLPFEISQLSVRNAGLNDKGTKAVVEGAASDNGELELLDLSQNRMGKETILKFCKVVQQKKFNLKILNLSGNKLGDSMMKAMMTALQKSTGSSPLECLYLSNNNINTSSRGLAEFISETRSLRVLDISWNCLRAEGVGEIMASLAMNNSIKELRMGWNSMGQGSLKSLVHLCQMLHTNSTLEIMDLTSNQIKEKVAAVIISSLPSNATLKSLILSENPIGPAGGRCVMRQLLNSEIDCTIELQKCNFGVQITWPSLGREEGREGGGGGVGPFIFSFLSILPLKRTRL
jgi:hypothetical protein